MQVVSVKLLHNITKMMLLLIVSGVEDKFYANRTGWG